MSPPPDALTSASLPKDGDGLPPAAPLRAERRGKLRGMRDAARHSFNLYFLTPILLIVISTMVALVGGTLWLTTLQNRAEGIKERERVHTAFVARIAAVEATTKVFAVWNDATRELLWRFDPDWADVNQGQYVYVQNGIEATFIIDRAGRVMFRHLDGKQSQADPAALLGKGYVAAVRRITSAPGVIDGPISGTTMAARGTALFSIVRIRPHGPTISAPAGVHRYVVMAKYIDRNVLDDLARGSNGTRLAFVRRPRADFSNWTFTDFSGSEARSFSWHPDAPGSRLRLGAIPWLTLLICVMGVLAAMVLVRARKAARELIASETKALYLANRDSLTGLPNRRSFSAHLLELEQSPARRSLLFLDLDGFKRVNDTYGHGIGDKLLCRTAERLQRVLPPSVFLARLGGDEFAITLPSPAARGELDAMATRLIEAVNEPHRFGGEPTTVGVSIGIASNERGDYEETVRHADTAMYVAKARGRNSWQHYEATLDAGREERRQLECDLKQALATRQIFVVFQPIVDAHSHRICAVEALARWTHPTRGPISPDIFISIAEESGLIVELGRQILEQACRAARHWPYRLAVNLSPAQFWHRNLVNEVIDTLDRCDFPASKLEFEITETYLLRRPDAAEAVIKALRRRGARIALDDFGTGYASIGYLRRFQFDLVKIDRSLVEAVVYDSAAADVFVAIVSLCKALGLPILAEGVESGDQAAMLTENGCAYLQGWHFGRPMRAAQIDQLVDRRRVA